MIATYSTPHVDLVDFDPFSGPEIARVAPSTESQMEIWTACLLGGDDATRSYNLSNSLRFRGPFDRQAMVQAIQALVHRHDALRAVFSTNGEHLFIQKTVLIDVAYQDISTDAASGQAQQLADYLQQDAQHVFDLYQGPLLKAGLFRLSDLEHCLVLTTHHSTRDGWSMGVMLQDLSALYSGYVQGSTPHLPEAPSFARYAEEQFQYADSAEYQEAETFWLNTYKDNVPTFDLPTDFPRPAGRTFDSNRLDYPLESDLVLAVKKMGLKAGCSFVTTLLAAFEVLLHRLSGQEDIIVGLPTAGQSITGNKRLVGHCVNLLPLRSHLQTDLSFHDFLTHCRRSVFDAHEHQRLTFSSLLRHLNIPRDSSRPPLVPVIFNTDMGMNDGVDFCGLKHEFSSHPKAYENFELFFNASGTEKSLTLEWAYNPHLFKAETIDRMMTDFRNLLKTVVADPSVAIGAIPFHSEHKLSKKLTQWNNTRAEYPSQTPLHALITQTATRYPHKTALVYQDQTLSYQTLTENANQLAHYLIEQGVRVGDIVGIALDRSPDLLIALLAVLKTGAAYLPLDPGYPDERLTFMLTDSSASLFITSQKYQGRLKSQATELLMEPALTEAQVYATDEPDRLVSGDDLAYVLYTSGSTGKPKGVLIEHHNLVNFLWSMREVPGISPNDRLLAVTTVSFDISGLELYLPLIVGATLVMADTATTRDGHALLSLLESQQISLLQATPSTWRMLLDADWTRPLPLKALCGGEGLPADLAEKLISQCDEVWNVYGPTETTIWSTVKRISKNELITIGRPIHNTQVYVLNEFQKPVAEDVVGELYIAGDGVARGYLNRPSLTNERFVKNPFGPLANSLMYRTGDLGKFSASGELQCLGRIDQQVKIRGHRIELGEIENALLTISDVKEAVVVAKGNDARDHRLVAYVVPESTATNDQAPSWKDRWDMIYHTGVDQQGQLNPSEQYLEVAIAEQLSGKKGVKAEIDEWLQQSIKRIRQLSPKRILEVGCGAGQLVFELAPGATSYIGTDYSETAILNLQEKLALDARKWSNVRTAVASADDFSTIKEASLDLVLIHSVAQYFPDADYLLRVIDQAAKTIEPGGCIFLGDMQGKNTLRMHHTVDQFQRSSSTTTVADFKKVVDRRVFIEDELLADPAFFYLLPNYIPAVSAVNIQLREGEHLNETTKYHYDVWLYIGEAPRVVSADTLTDWRQGYDLQRLEQDLSANPTIIWQFQNVFNSRTAIDYGLVQRINALSPDALLADARLEATATPPGIDPSRLWALGEQYNYSAHVRWSDDGTDNLLDVVFIPNSLGRSLPAYPSSIESAGQSLSRHIRNPFKHTVTVPAEQIQDWKRQIGKQLPDYMVPGEFVLLNKLPLTANGKIDRKALPEPVAAQATDQTGPRTATEQLVARLWSETLRLDNISIFDNFFELGGHSLIAVRIMTRIEKETGKRLPLSTLFEHSTIEKLAQVLEADKVVTTWKSLVPIKPKGTKPPVYFVHGTGSNVLLFNRLATSVSPDQPVYGLQALGLNEEDKPLSDIKEMAAFYNREIIEQNPSGPYSIIGYSFGGYIAFEMAKQLKEMGKEVKLLGMIDTNALAKTAQLFVKRGPNKIRMRHFVKLTWIVRSMSEKPVETMTYWSRYARVVVTLRLKNLLNKASSAEVEFLDLHDINENLEIAHRNYQMSPYEGNIHLFKVQISPYSIKKFRFLGWEKYTSIGVKLHEIPGDHYSMLTPPNDKKFSQILQNVLDNC